MTEAAVVVVTIMETFQLLNIRLKKMKDRCFSKLTMTETRHQAPQYKKIIDTLPALCADKNNRSINDVLCNGIDLVKAEFTFPYPNSDLWSKTHDIEITSVNQTVRTINEWQTSA